MEKRFHKTGPVTIHPERLSIPLKTGKPTVWAVWNDLFHKDVDPDFILRAFAWMDRTPQHTFLVLTKRPENMLKFCREYGLIPSGLPSPACTTPSGVEVPENVWMGCTICNQQETDEKIPVFLRAPGKKFLSIEPILGRVDLLDVRFSRSSRYNVLEGCGINTNSLCQSIPNAYCNKIDAVICGGETGPGARPMNPDWVRSLRDQCEVSGTPFFFKQWGEFATVETIHSDLYPEKDFDMIDPDGRGYWRVGKKKAGRALDGRFHGELPWHKANTMEAK